MDVFCCVLAWKFGFCIAQSMVVSGKDMLEMRPLQRRHKVDSLLAM